MRLVAAASAFNKTPCVDAYSGAHVFFAQLGLYDDNKRDSETTERRILSVAAGTRIPTRRVVEAAGTRFIVGHSNPDTFKGKVLRIGYVAHEVTDLSHVRTLAQVCLLQDGFEAWAGKAWVKNLAFSEQSSRLVPQHHIHFSQTEAVTPNKLVTFGGKLLVVRAVNDGPAGTLISLCDELPEPVVEVVTMGSSVYDPISDTMTGATASVRVVRVRWQSMFLYGTKGAPAFGPDDIQVVIAKAAASPLPGTKLTMSDGVWQVSAVDDGLDVWLCRATQHG